MDEKTRQAFDILWETRETLLKYLVEEILEKEAILVGKTNYEGAMGFDYQELDNKFMGRLSSLNTFLHNLSASPQSATRRPTVTNRVEVLQSTLETLEQDVNESLKKYSALKLASTTVRDCGEGKLLVLLAFTSA